MNFLFHDQSEWARILVRGSDRTQFLHNLTTNDVKGLGPGAGQDTVMSTVKGRILAAGQLYRFDAELALVLQPDARKAVLEHLEFYHFSEDVEFEDVTDSTCLLALDLEPSSLPEGIRSRAARILAYARFGREGCRIWAKREELGPLKAELEALGGRELQPGELEAMRVACGEPAFGPELGLDRNPLEAGLYGSVSFEKGCYLGQEVIARLDTYNKVARVLMRLRLGSEALDELHGKPMLTLEDQEVGWLTSWTPAKQGDGFDALGYVQRRCTERELLINGRAAASVIEVVKR